MAFSQARRLPPSAPPIVSPHRRDSILSPGACGTTASRCGWRSIRQNRAMRPPARPWPDGPDDIVSTVKDAGLKGRGGAGFSTGVKWGLMPKDESMNIRYLLCNADEMEPGTYKPTAC